MLNERLQKLREFTQARSFSRYRRKEGFYPLVIAGGSEDRRNTELFKARCQAEVPIVLPNERIAFTRSCSKLRGISYRWSITRITRAIRHRLAHFFPVLAPDADGAPIGNVCPDYSKLLNAGLNGLKGKNAWRDAAIDALLELVGRYAEEAKRIGNLEIASMLQNVPAERPRSFHEALQAVRVVSSAMYLANAYQCGFGRMDQYLLPFYRQDIDTGKVNRDQALELIEEFFISLNRDSDLYYGVQQGDNGQSIMLGGCIPSTGASAVNELTYLFIEAAREVRLIDPKINLRIDSNTPRDLLELGSSLTKCGLGFPQYSNDEVVVPALVSKGYAIEDARDYTVAACWEFIIPGKGLEVVNLGAVSFPYAVDMALREEVATNCFEEKSFRARIAQSIKQQIEHILKSRKPRFGRFPFVEAFFDDEIKYRNIGIHGAGSANAADALVAILEKAGIIETRKDIGRVGIDGLKELIDAQDANFEGYGKLHEQLVNDLPKVGNADPIADHELTFLFDVFADVAAHVDTRIRPGSGSAQFYVWLTEEGTGEGVEPVVGATSDGRYRNAPLASSLAPANEVKVNGVLSVFKSFSQIDYQRIMNGGPVTIELSHTIFDSPEGELKLAQLIQYFVKLRCQQLQLNVLNVTELEDALAHPERHRNLIVRVWGWSGYFCELSPEFQRQIIGRHRYGE